MKSLELELPDNSALPLPLTIWQEFSEASSIKKVLHKQFMLRAMLVLMPMFLITMFFIFATIKDSYFFDIFFLVFLLISAVGHLILLVLGYCYFYFKYYKKFILLDKHPLPVLTLDNNTICLYDNAGELIKNIEITEFKEVLFSTSLVKSYLFIATASQSYYYTLFVSKACVYYVEINKKYYSIDPKKLPNLIYDVISQAKENLDSVRFNKHYYIHGC